MKLSRLFFLLFCLLAGVVVGAMIANLCADIPALSWLAYYNSIGFDAVTIDLAVLKASFGLNLGVSVAQIITIIIALFVYAKVKIR